MLFYLRALCIKPVCRVSLVCAVAGVQLTGTTISMRKRLQVNLLMDKQPISLLPWTDFFPNVRRTFVPILWSDVVSWWSALQSVQVPQSSYLFVCAWLAECRRGVFWSSATVCQQTLADDDFIHDYNEDVHKPLVTKVSCCASCRRVVMPAAVWCCACRCQPSDRCVALTLFGQTIVLWLGVGCAVFCLCASIVLTTVYLRYVVAVVGAGRLRCQLRVPRFNSPARSSYTDAHTTHNPIRVTHTLSLSHARTRTHTRAHTHTHTHTHSYCGARWPCDR